MLCPDDAGCRDYEHGSQNGTGTDRFKAAAALVDFFVNQRGDVINALLNTKYGNGAEMCHGIEHNKQGATHDRWHNQGNGDFAGDGKKACTRNAGGFLQGGIHTLERAANLDEDKGEEVHNLYRADAVVGVNIKHGTGKAEGLHKEFVDIAAVR